MNFLRSMKVGTKILFASTILIVLTIIVALQGISSLRTASTKFDEFYSERFIPVRQLNHIMRNILQIRINTLQELEAAQTNRWDDSEKRRNNSKELTEEYMNLWNKFKSRNLTGKEKELADEWLALTVNPKEDRVMFAKAIDERNMAKAKQFLDHWLEGFRPLRDKTDELIRLQQEKAEILQAEVKSSERQAIIISVAILALSLLTGISISIMLSRNITGQLGGEPADVMDAAGKMAEGDFTVEYSLKKDDSGSAMAAMKKMTDGLSGLITGVIFSAQNLAQAVEQISMGNQNLSQRTSEQASSLEEIASTIEEATATINQSADNADKARDLTNAGVNKSLEGNKVALEAVSAITEMNDASKKMADIITTINEISFQTNLLALNASVEAARAGEQGRGFAVVAGEVRNLAQRSGNSAKEIEALIKDTVLKMESSTSLVENTSSSLSEISESAQTSAQIISEIATASQEQKQGINQINTAVSEMDKMTQQNAALVEETASASEEMANQAQELLEMVGKFKISEHLGAIDSRSEHLKHLAINSLYDGNKNDSNGNGKHKLGEHSAAFIQHKHGHEHSIDQLAKDEGFEKF